MFGLFTTVGGLVVLMFLPYGPAAAIVAGVTFVLYVFAYTPAKSRTWWNTFIGAVPGATPPEIVARLNAETVKALEMPATRCVGLFLETVREYNAAVRQDVPFDHTVKDGKCTVNNEAGIKAMTGRAPTGA